MDLLGGAADEASQQQAPKAREVGASPLELKKYSESTMKTTCSLKFAERIFRAVCTDTYTLDPTDEFVVQSKATSVQFNKQAKELSAEARRRTIGEPHVQVFNTWAKLALQHHQSKNNEAEVKRLTKFNEIMMVGGKEKALERLLQQVKYAYVTHPRGGNGKRKSRLEANVRETIVEIDPGADPAGKDLGLKIRPCPCYAAWLSIQMALLEKGAEH